MKPLTLSTDPNLARVIPGVRQDEHGRAYRIGEMRDGAQVMVEAPDSRRYEVSDGSFDAGTRHVIVTDGDGTVRHL